MARRDGAGGSGDIACRYIESSWEVNMTMSGLGRRIDRRYATWTKSEIAAVKKRLDALAVTAGPEIPETLFRGAGASPVLEPTTDESTLLARFAARTPAPTNRSYLSTSKARDVAKGFAGRKGYVHVLHLAPGCRVVDMNDAVRCDGVVAGAQKLEREILLAPGHVLAPLRKYGRALHWRVSFAASSCP